jgi:2-oxoglutarate dehydrogenase E1 component
MVIDQFISSGEQKWERMCGLVLFLPHGYEGQGPEHSSARLERFMQLCAQSNMQVCVPSSPAQCFHMLRRQMLRKVRKPLIVMTPKSLLRHKLAVSSLKDLTEGSFQLIIKEVEALDPKQVRRVVLCSGKVYYDLLEKRQQDALNHVAIIRVEQLYPFPVDELKEALAIYQNAKTVVWCQEEPMNQGAWYCALHWMKKSLADFQTLQYAGRDSFAAPAVGDPQVHKEQQQALVLEALMNSD